MGFLTAEPDVWRFQPHPEVWLVIAAIVGFGAWIRFVLASKAVRSNQVAVSKVQLGSFWIAVVLLWLSSDWPMHDISEEYLYAVHMIQHLLISLCVPPLLLMATPEWLARLVVSANGQPGVWARRLTRPVAAAVIFNFVSALTHMPNIVNFSISNGAFHYFVHLIVFATAVLMWMPVVSPLPELRATRPGQMIYLFLNSLLPTVPGAFLTFAESPLYASYDHTVRLWGISVVHDQQVAGLIMKVAGGTFIWVIILIIFFRWVAAERDMRPELSMVETSSTAQRVMPG